MSLDWLACTYRPNGEYDFFDNTDGVRAFANRQGQEMGILVVNHSHGLAKALLLHSKQHEAFQNIAIVLATDEPEGVAETLCTRYAAHAYVSQANAKAELKLLFGSTFEA